METDDIAAFVDTLPKSFFNTFMKVIGKNDQLYLSVKEEELTWIRKLCGDDFTAAQKTSQSDHMDHSLV